MIHKNSVLSVERIDLDRLHVTEFMPRDLDRVKRYAALLTDQPDYDMEPIVVQPSPAGYAILNGHHRFTAHLVAGRRNILAIIQTGRSAP